MLQQVQRNLILTGLVLLCLGFGAYLRVTNLGVNNPLFDEEIAMSIAYVESASEAVSLSKYHSPPALHVVFSHLFSSAGRPESFAEMRLMSLALGFLLLLCSFPLLYRLVGFTGAAASLGLLSVSPLLIAWSRVFRMYAHHALYCGLIVIAYMGMCKQSDRKGWLILFGLCAFLIPSTSFPGGLLVVAVVGHYVCSRAAKREKVKVALIGGGAALASLAISFSLKVGNGADLLFEKKTYMQIGYLNAKMPFWDFLGKAFSLVGNESGFVLVGLLGLLFLLRQRLDLESESLRDLKLLGEVFIFTVVLNLVATYFTSVPFGHYRMMIFFAPLLAIMGGLAVRCCLDHDLLNRKTCAVLVALLLVSISASHKFSILSENSTVRVPKKASIGYALAKIRQRGGGDQEVYLFKSWYDVAALYQKFDSEPVVPDKIFEYHCMNKKFRFCISSNAESFWVSVAGWQHVSLENVVILDEIKFAQNKVIKVENPRFKQILSH